MRNSQLTQVGKPILYIYFFIFWLVNPNHGFCVLLTETKICEKQKLKLNRLVRFGSILIWFFDQFDFLDFFTHP